MKSNRLLNEIVRGQWLLDPFQIEGYAPFIHSMLTKGNLAFPQDKEAKLEMQLMDEDGESISQAEETEESKIAKISMIGPVLKYGDFCTYGANEIVAMLDQANSDPKVKGIIFYIDGPGGAASAINPFVDFAKRKSKPLVVLADMACSLHYWSLCAVADYIIGENAITGRFGSVGIVSSFVDARPHLEEQGYKFHEIYPEESSEKNKVFRLALEGKYDRIKKEHLSPIAIKFQNAVKTARPNLKEKPGVLTGGTFETEEALELSMIDAIGNMETAIERINILSEVNSI